MISPPAGVRIWLAAGATDMRRGFDGLASLVAQQLNHDPFSGQIFAFRGRKGHLIKLLFWDGQGLVLYAKRLERGHFVCVGLHPRGDEGDRRSLAVGLARAVGRRVRADLGRRRPRQERARPQDRRSRCTLACRSAGARAHPGFVPEAPTQELRSLLRTRKHLVCEQASHVQRIQKTLKNANLKLGSVLSQVMGVSGRTILQALIDGQSDPDVLLTLVQRGVRAPPEKLRAALTGRITERHPFLLRLHLRQFDNGRRDGRDRGRYHAAAPANVISEYELRLDWRPLSRRGCR